MNFQIVFSFIFLCLSQAKVTAPYWTCTLYRDKTPFAWLMIVVIGFLEHNLYILDSWKPSALEINEVEELVEMAIMMNSE